MSNNDRYFPNYGTKPCSVNCGKRLDKENGYTDAWQEQKIKNLEEKLSKLSSELNEIKEKFDKVKISAKEGKKKKLEELTRTEFITLKNMGMLWEFYPEAPDTFEEIKEKFDVVFEEKMYHCNGIFGGVYSENGNLNKIVERYLNVLGDISGLKYKTQKVKISAKKNKIVIEKVGE